MELMQYLKTHLVTPPKSKEKKKKKKRDRADSPERGKKMSNYLKAKVTAWGHRHIPPLWKKLQGSGDVGDWRSDLKDSIAKWSNNKGIEVYRNLCVTKDNMKSMLRGEFCPGGQHVADDYSTLGDVLSVLMCMDWGIGQDQLRTGEQAQEFSVK